MIQPLTLDPPQTQPASAVDAQALVGTLQAALEQTHNLWATTPARSAKAAQLCVIDRKLQQLVWDAGHLIED